MMSGIFVGDITQVLYFEFKKNLHSLSKLVKYRGVRRFFAFVRNVYLFSLTVDGRSTSWYGKYPIIYRVFFTSKRWLGLNLGISEPSTDITTLWEGQPVTEPCVGKELSRLSKRWSSKFWTRLRCCKVPPASGKGLNVAENSSEWGLFKVGCYCWIFVAKLWALRLFQFFLSHMALTVRISLLKRSGAMLLFFFAGKGTLLLGDITGSTVDFLATSLGI